MFWWCYVTVTEVGDGYNIGYIFELLQCIMLLCYSFTCLLRAIYNNAHIIEIKRHHIRVNVENLNILQQLA